MQPMYSPDGRFWWDGRQWQPVPDNTNPDPAQQGWPGQQYETGQQNQPSQQNGPQQMPGPYGPPQQQPPGFYPPGPGAPRRKSRAPLIIVGIIVAALVIIAIPVTFIVLRPSGSGGSAEADGPASAPTLKPGEPITQGKLNKVAPDAFYFDVLDRQMTQPISLVTNAWFQRPADFTAHKTYHLNRVGVDHRNGKPAEPGQFTAERSSYTDGKPDEHTRCVGKQTYMFSEDWKTGKKRWNSDHVPDQCKSIERWRTYASDGVVASGLNHQQADTVQSALRDEYQGFANPSRPTLIKASGKSYIRQVVDYKPTKLADNNYYGTQIFIWAFQKSKLDSLKWPFVPGLGGGEGLHIVYYYDTKTLLPTTAMMRSTPVLGENGQVVEDYKQTELIAYTFPDKLKQLDLKDAKPVVIKPPEGWKFTK